MRSLDSCDLHVKEELWDLDGREVTSCASDADLSSEIYVKGCVC